MCKVCGCGEFVWGWAGLGVGLLLCVDIFMLCGWFVWGRVWGVLLCGFVGVGVAR